MEAATPTKSRMQASARRELIVGKARRLFGHHGYAATRLDDIAAAAGVTKPMVYRHFASKKELYMELLRHHEANLPTFIEDAAMPADAGPPEIVGAVLALWFDYIEEHSDAWLVIFRDKTGDPDIERARRRVNARATEILIGFIRDLNPELDPELLEPTADFLRSGLAGLVLWWIDHPGVSRETVHTTATRACLAVSRSPG